MDNAIDMGFGNTLQMSEQKIVQPLAGVLFVHREVDDLWRVQNDSCLRVNPMTVEAAVQRL